MSEDRIEPTSFPLPDFSPMTDDEMAEDQDAIQIWVPGWDGWSHDLPDQWLGEPVILQDGTKYLILDAETFTTGPNSGMTLLTLEVDK